MKVSDVSSWVALTGTVFLALGIAAIWYSAARPTREDISLALAPIAHVRLDKIEESRRLSIPVVISDAPAWQRLRRWWGDPDFVILAASPRKEALCLPRLGLQIQVLSQGSPLPIKTGSAPYGYSSLCEGGSLRFHAAPLTKLIVQTTASSKETLPQGTLIVMADWLYLKDHLVGEMLDRIVSKLGVAMLLVGLLLLGASGAGFLYNRRMRPIG